MSSINQFTIDLPATGTKGFGVVSVCGRILLPIPAIGIISFILISNQNLVQISLKTTNLWL
jgi:hypothetical protein